MVTWRSLAKPPTSFPAGVSGERIQAFFRIHRRPLGNAGAQETSPQYEWWLVLQQTRFEKNWEMKKGAKQGIFSGEKKEKENQQIRALKQKGETGLF